MLRLSKSHAKTSNLTALQLSYVSSAQLLCVGSVQLQSVTSVAMRWLTCSVSAQLHPVRPNKLVILAHPVA